MLKTLVVFNIFINMYILLLNFKTMTKKLLAILSLLVVSTSSLSAYEEIECSTDTVFSEYSCNQCFTWESKSEWDLLGLLSDVWMNVTEVQKILYKEEQLDPEMISLDTTNVTWIETPDSNGFWEYTDEFNELYSDIEEWYILDPGKSVTWIKSNLSHAYKLERNTADAGENIGLLVYPISTHNILADGEITIDNSEHKECVLFKSAEAGEEPETPERLPETGPSEFILLAILAMILGFGIVKFRTKS